MKINIIKRRQYRNKQTSLKGDSIKINIIKRRQLGCTRGEAALREREGPRRLSSAVQKEAKAPF